MEREQVSTQMDILEFQEVKGMRVSQPFSTPKGESVKVMYLSETKVAILGEDGLTIHVNGNIDKIPTSIAKSFFGGLWDKLKGIAGAIKDIITGGGAGGGACQQTTGNIEVNVNISGDGSTANLSPNSVNVNVQCTTPQQ